MLRFCQTLYTYTLALWYNSLTSSMIDILPLVIFIGHLGIICDY